MRNSKSYEANTVRYVVKLKNQMYIGNQKKEQHAIQFAKKWKTKKGAESVATKYGKYASAIKITRPYGHPIYNWQWSLAHKQA